MLLRRQIYVKLRTRQLSDVLRIGGTVDCCGIMDDHRL